MNCTKFIPPQPFFLNFYFYYTNFVLFLCLLLAPFQFYIILTKSKNLKHFKGFILNHSIWSIIFEAGLTLTKPVLLSPTIAAFPIGVIRNGSFHVTIIIGYVGGIVSLTYASSLTATLVYRYLFAFPTVFKLLEKFFFVLYILCTVGVYVIGTYAVKDIFNTDPEYFYQAAIDYDPCMHIYVPNEPGFVFWPKTEVTHFGILISLFIFICGIICAVCLAIFFIYLVISQKSQTLEKLQRSLVMSSIVQLSISISLIFTPLAIVVSVFYFEISNMENVIILFFCIIMSHSLIESIATLYFVTPYRKAALEILSRAFPCYKTKTVKIFPVTQTEVTNRNGNRYL